ncbi:MAG TPA: SDR family oxidoreductase [Solirubrobacteraceae bacterium]|nr:SDR family oxidoreductase [Solirubrobacteraceae bacterium]
MGQALTGDPRAARAGEGTLVLTGATGFVGMALLERWLERTSDHVIAPVRAICDAQAQERIDAVLNGLFGERAVEHRPRVRALAADLAAPGLGLEARVRDGIAERATTIIHAAASVAFSLALHRARAINVEGTRRMLELARCAQERGALRHYAQISTAYVAGTHPGSFCEDDHDVGQRFHNSYERSKFEAELLVREHTGLPSSIIRPSIVVGDRQTGWTAAFNVLYWPLRALSRGLFPAIPARADSPLDVVSIDYVADAIVELVLRHPGAGATHHLTAGPLGSSIGELAALASAYFGVALPEMVDPEHFARLPLSPAQREALAAGAEYFPYFCIDTTFEDRATRARLAGTGIRVDPLRDYLPTLLDFATASRWGKRPITRAQALAWGGARIRAAALARRSRPGAAMPQALAVGAAR